MEKASGTIRVIVFKDADLWVAQCIEHDIGAQAPDVDTLMARLQVVMSAELKESLDKHKVPFAGIEPAPERFSLMWDRRARVEMTPPAWMVNAQQPIALGLVA